MHIAHASKDLLVVEHRPAAMGIALVALAVAGPVLLFRAIQVDGALGSLLGIFMMDFPLMAVFSVGVRRLMIVLDRRQDRLALHERSVFRDRQLQASLHMLVRAERETNFVGIPFLPAHGHYHRAVLVLAENHRLRRVPVTSVFLVGPSARRATRAINGWLGRPLDSKVPAA